MTFLEVNQIVIAQVIADSYCSNPSIPQYAAIIALILGSGVISVVGGISILALATTLTTLILSGANIEALTAAIAAQLGAVATSTEIVAYLYQGIKNILGC